jgi:hypothetical protein
MGQRGDREYKGGKQYDKIVTIEVSLNADKNHI